LTWFSKEETFVQDVEGKAIETPIATFVKAVMHICAHDAKEKAFGMRDVANAVALD
jgi:hypothetical protein